MTVAEQKGTAAILEQPVMEKVLTHLGLQARNPTCASPWLAAASGLRSFGPHVCGGPVLALLSNVTEVRLSVEAMFGPEVQGIDNFTVTAIPEPATYGMLALGLAVVGWAHRRRATGQRGCAGRSAW